MTIRIWPGFGLGLDALVECAGLAGLWKAMVFVALPRLQQAKVMENKIKDESSGYGTWEKRGKRRGLTEES